MFQSNVRKAVMAVVNQKIQEAQLKYDEAYKVIQTAKASDIEFIERKAVESMELAMEDCVKEVIGNTK